MKGPMTINCPTIDCPLDTFLSPSKVSLVTLKRPEPCCFLGTIKIAKAEEEDVPAKESDVFFCLPFVSVLLHSFISTYRMAPILCRWKIWQSAGVLSNLLMNTGNGLTFVSLISHLGWDSSLSLSSMDGWMRRWKKNFPIHYRNTNSGTVSYRLHLDQHRNSDRQKVSHGTNLINFPFNFRVLLTRAEFSTSSSFLSSLGRTNKPICF